MNNLLVQKVGADSNTVAIFARQGSEVNSHETRF